MRYGIAFLVALLIFFLCAIFGGYAWWNWATAAAQPGVQPTTRITVKSGATVAGVGRDLEKKNLIRSARAFALVGKETVIHPGVYDFSPAETPAALLRHLAKSEFATERLTIPEGFTLRQIAQRLKAQSLITDENSFLTLTQTQGNTLHASFAPPANLEGFMFPDTYQIPLGSNSRQLAQLMLGAFDKHAVQPNAVAIKSSARSFPDVINVAAMIEREAEVDADRPLIASVIYNRLKKGMRLQIDATVQYARGQHVARLLYKDLEVDSPYNTYKIVGLPPGPICNPGLPSIEAALKPANTDYLFYVGGPGQAHRFSKTYAEHLKNIALVRAETAAAAKNKVLTSAGAR